MKVYFIPLWLDFCVNGFITNNGNRADIDFHCAQVLSR